ncbi:IS3 family transposase [Paenibacillus larvae]|uniref:IS3 family transposase n=1 Tax=Paenibacillus larvae TaxID=1464 RepID=UPI00227E9DA1|nr:IS3 family transposase [Paenibacillus larvae]MCY9748972.1 IS3 family transposase [Paenibacillus larvae]MEC0085708.1 IS3 family transposase [Paenibacillus larvae]
MLPKTGYEGRSQISMVSSLMKRLIKNGPMESFWGMMKSEMYYLHSYSTYEELKKDIDNYIYFYNNERLQAKLKSL